MTRSSSAKVFVGGNPADVCFTRTRANQYNTFQSVGVQIHPLTTQKSLLIIDRACSPAASAPAPRGLTRLTLYSWRAARRSVVVALLRASSLGEPLLLSARVIEQVAPGPALERPRHVLVALGDVGEGGPLLRIAGSGGETWWV